MGQEDKGRFLGINTSLDASQPFSHSVGKSVNQFGKDPQGPRVWMPVHITSHHVWCFHMQNLNQALTRRDLNKTAANCCCRGNVSVTLNWSDDLAVSPTETLTDGHWGCAPSHRSRSIKKGQKTGHILNNSCDIKNDQHHKLLLPVTSEKLKK